MVPTVGFKVEQFSKNNINFTMFDMSGASTHRDLWTAYYSEAQAIIFVIDCKDKLRVCVAKKELDDMLAHPGTDTAVPLLCRCCAEALFPPRTMLGAVAAHGSVPSASQMENNCTSPTPHASFRSGIADIADKRIPFLFFANKMDIAGCLSPFECCASLGLDDIKTKPWHITCAHSTFGYHQFC